MDKGAGEKRAERRRRGKGRIAGVRVCESGEK